MTLTGFSLPELSAFDPPVEGEGSLDPMGLGRHLGPLGQPSCPRLRARMRRVRFVTAIAVGALACETLAEEIAADGISTPSICFEWLVVEAFVRRLPGGQGFPLGVPGSFKARAVVARSQRLSAATYLKGPSVFGFHGVYKPFAVDSDVVGSGLEPGASCSELTRQMGARTGFRRVHRWCARHHRRQAARPDTGCGPRHASGWALCDESQRPAVRAPDGILASRHSGAQLNAEPCVP